VTASGLCDGFWPPELSGCPSMLITAGNESVRNGDAVG